MLQVIGLIGIILFGGLMFLILTRKFSIMEFMSVGYLLGLGLFTFFMFIMNRFNISFQLFNVSFLLAVLIIVELGILYYLFLNKKISLPSFSISIKKLGLFEVIALVLVLYSIGSIIFYSIYIPVHDWDSMTLYDYRARFYIFTGGMGNSDYPGYDYSYTPLTSLGHTFVYLFGGINPTIMHALIFLSIIGVFYSTILKNFTLKTILFFIIFMAGSELFYHSYRTYVNLPYAVYFATSVICGYLWLKEKNKGYLILSVIFCGLSTWARNAEPFWLNLLFLIFLFIILLKDIIWKKTVLILATILIFSAIQLPWAQYQYINKVSVTRNIISVSKDVGQSGIRFIKVMLSRFFIKSSEKKSVSDNLKAEIKPTSWSFSETSSFVWGTSIKPWKLLYLMAILSTMVFFMQREKKKEDWFCLLAVVLNFGLMVIGIFITSQGTYDNWRNIPDSVRRMAMFMEPLLILFIAVISAPYIDKGLNYLAQLNQNKDI